jgi:hypothetical protein
MAIIVAPLELVEALSYATYMEMTEAPVFKPVTGSTEEARFK